MSLTIRTWPDLERALKTHDAIRGRFVGTKMQYFVGSTRVEPALIRQVVKADDVTTKWEGAMPVIRLRQAALTTPVTAAARSTDPATSHQAARVVSSKMAASQNRVLDMLTRRGGLTHDDMCTIEREDADIEDRERDFSDSRLRSATAELVQAGRVEAKGKKPTGHGTHTTIWGLTTR